MDIWSQLVSEEEEGEDKAEEDRKKKDKPNPVPDYYGKLECFDSTLRELLRDWPLKEETIVELGMVKDSLTDQHFFLQKLYLMMLHEAKREKDFEFLEQQIRLWGQAWIETRDVARKSHACRSIISALLRESKPVDSTNTNSEDKDLDSVTTAFPLWIPFFDN